MPNFNSLKKRIDELEQKTQTKTIRIISHVPRATNDGLRADSSIIEIRCKLSD